MIKNIFIACTLSFSFTQCKQKEMQKPETALDAGRAFIRASLDGNFKDAENLLLKDSQNVQMLSSNKTYYNRLSQEKKIHYKKASYTINKYQDANDSTTIINYSNDYMKKPMEIKVVWDHNEWKIDFKYITSENTPLN